MKRAARGRPVRHTPPPATRAAQQHAAAALPVCSVPPVPFRREASGRLVRDQQNQGFRHSAPSPGLERRDRASRRAFCEPKRPALGCHWVAHPACLDHGDPSALLAGPHRAASVRSPPARRPAALADSPACRRSCIAPASRRKAGRSVRRARSHAGGQSSTHRASPRARGRRFPLGPRSNHRTVGDHRHPLPGAPRAPGRAIRFMPAVAPAIGGPLAAAREHFRPPK